MPKKRLVQSKLKFFTYTKYRLEDEKKLEQERKEAKEEHLKRIRQILNAKPKQLLPKKEKKIITNEQPPWGDLPEMYPGQHQGKPFLPINKKGDQEKKDK